jgi:hypothetical protein
MEKTMDTAVYSAMQAGKPFKTYRKTILGQVYVKVLNPFSGTPEGVILKGRDGEETTMVDVWSVQEDMFFKKQNRKQFQGGFVIEYERPTVEAVSEEEKYNTLPDDQLVELLSSKFIALQNALNKMTSPAPVYRMLKMAQDMEKSDKIIAHIRARLSELQASDEE